MNEHTHTRTFARAGTHTEAQRLGQRADRTGMETEGGGYKETKDKEQVQNNTSRATKGKFKKNKAWFRIVQRIFRGREREGGEDTEGTKKKQK